MYVGIFPTMKRRDCIQESESENIVKCVYLDISKFNCICSAEYIVVSSGSLAGNAFLFITAAAATLFLSFEPSV